MFVTLFWIFLEPSCSFLMEIILQVTACRYKNEIEDKKKGGAFTSWTLLRYIFIISSDEITTYYFKVCYHFMMLSHLCFNCSSVMSYILWNITLGEHTLIICSKWLLSLSVFNTKKCFMYGVEFHTAKLFFNLLIYMYWF